MAQLRVRTIAEHTAYGGGLKEEGNMSEKKMVVLHASHAPADVARALDAARGLAKVHPDLDIHVMVNGDAIEGLTSDAAKQIPDGVQVQACSIGLRNHGVDAAQISQGVELIPGAVTAIVEAELAGALYIRI